MHGYGIPCVSGQPSPRNNWVSGILKVFPSLKPPMFPSKSVKWETSDEISQETLSYLKNIDHKAILNYYAAEHFSYWLEQMQERGAHFQ
jgi:hypothetical protein